jgi:uncharacterized protein YkwD
MGGCVSKKDRNKKTIQGNTSRGGAYVINNKKFVKDALKEHNFYRKNHGVHTLKLNKTLCNTAQRWAEQIAETNNFEHSNNTYNGQSLGK